MLLMKCYQEQPISAQSYSTVYIRPDGGIDPSTAPIKRAGDIYAVIGNIIDSVLIQRSNIMLDGAGFTLKETAPNSRATAIDITLQSNVTVKNLKIQFPLYGIAIENSANVTISDCSVNLSSSRDPELPTGSAINVHDSSKVSIVRNDITSTVDIAGAPFIGVGMLRTSASNISENNISGFTMGIYNGNNNTISWNRLSQCPGGIVSGTYGEIFANTVFGTGNQSLGMWIDSNNKVYGNYLAGNGDGLIFKSANNSIYGNNFIDNDRQVSIDPYGAGSPNLWDNGEVGNYWSDYLAKYPNAREAGISGTGNTPYVIDENKEDHHPLLNPISAGQASRSLRHSLDKRDLYQQH